jgi:hypothetical protein
MQKRSNGSVSRVGCLVCLDRGAALMLIMAGTGADIAGLSTSRMKTEIGIRKLGERKRIRAAFDELLQNPS